MSVFLGANVCPYTSFCICVREAAPQNACALEVREDVCVCVCIMHARVLECAYSLTLDVYGLYV